MLRIENIFISIFVEMEEIFDILLYLNQKTVLLSSQYKSKPDYHFNLALISQTKINDIYFY